VAISKSVAIVVKMVGGMSKSEKRECSDILGPILGMKKGKGNTQPYWIKKVDSIDSTQTGPYAMDGKWLRDTTNLNPGEYCVIGIKYPPEDKRYSICCQDPGSTLSYKAGSMNLEFENVAEIHTFTGFADCLTEMKSLVPPSKAA